MAKAALGTKRICHSCGGRYYDMQRDPITCPKCNTLYDPEALLKTRRKLTVEPKPKVVPTPQPAAELEVEEAEAIAGETPAEGTEEVVIEDVSELGKDEEDVAEVIENVGKEER